MEVRGQRLELGEVEHHLLQCPDIEHAMALLPSSTPSSGRLTAVVALGAPANPSHPSSVPLESMEEYIDSDTAEKIRRIERLLLDKLPPFGIPTVWLPVRHMPLTPAGKLDRMQIRRWAHVALEQQSHSIVMDTPKTLENEVILSTLHERTLQNAWSEVLQIPADRIGADHSFHQLEGDSIHAIRLVSFLRSQGLALTVSNIFRHPVLRDMAKEITPLTLRETEPSRFSLLPVSDLQTVVSGAARECSISTEEIADIYPATPLQEAVMTLNIIHPGTYFAQLVYEASDELDPETMLSAWQIVTRIHTILRTRLIHSPSLGTLQVVVNKGLPMIRADDLAAYLEEDCLEKIELGDAMARSALVGRYIVLTAHHAAYDGFSLPMIVEDLMLAYNRGIATQRPPFRNFVGFLQSADTASSEAFWSTYLSDLSPTDFPRDPKSNHQPHADASKRLTIDFGQGPRNGITTATAANAAWAIVLACYGDTQDVCFGTTLSGRDVLHDVARLPGPTLATVPVRHSVERTGTVHQFLQQVQTNVLDIMPHQHLGLQRIKRLDESCHAACDFRSLFVVFPPEDRHNQGLRLRTDLSTGDIDNFSMYPLAVLFRQTPSGAQVSLNYDSKIIPERQVDRIASYFEHVVRGILSSHNYTIINDVLDISPKDRAEIMLWNAGFPSEDTRFVHDMFSAKALERPSTVAVSAWDGIFSYQELEDLSNRLACDLSNRGAEEGTFVGYCFTKSKWTIVAMLATLKANAGFAPLNPSDSIERKRELVAQCGIDIILTSASIYEKHKGLTPTVIALDMIYLNEIKDFSGPPDVTITSDSSAFCIFTSGTTGKPKIPVISHSALATSIVSLSDALCITGTTRCLQFASHVFDLHVLEIMGPLILGGSVCIPSDDDRMNDLASFVSQSKIDCAMLTPTFLRSLRPKDFPSLRTVVLGGEVVGEDIIQNWATRVRLFSIWAPSETTIANTVIELHNPGQSGELGSPVNARLWIVQSQNTNLLAPIGAPGELIVSGPILAKGYHNDPERSAAAFVEGLKWSNRKTRCYRTGDIAQYDSDGKLRYIGRRDAQLKVCRLAAIV